MKKLLKQEDLARIGFISKAVGYRGEVLMAIEAGDPEDYASTSFFFIPLEGSPVPFLSEEVKLNDSSLIVKLQDVNTEAEARELSGKSCYIEKSGREEAEMNIDWDSLLGYAVIDTAYGELGPLESIQEVPQQLIGQCTVNNKEVLFPLADDFILSVDDEKKEIHLDLPEGLLDVYLK